MPAHDHPLAADNDADHLTQEDENLLNYFDEFEVFKQLTDIVAVMMREKPTDPEFFLLAQLRAWDASEQALGQPYYAASRYHLDGQEDGTRTPERERKEHTDALFNAQWYQIEEQRIAQQNERAKEQQAMFLQEVEAQAKKTNAKMEESEPLHNLLKKSAAFTCTQGTPAAAEDAILEVVNSLEPLTTFTVLQQLVRMGIITDAWELPMAARNYVSSSDDFTPLFHNMRFAYESPLHHYGEASPPSEAARLPPLDVPRLCFTIAHRIVTGDLAATKSEFADAHDVAHLQRVEDLVEGRQRSTNFAIHARTQFHPGCLQSLLQFRLMVRLAHMWFTVLTHPPSEWLRLLRITLYSLMGYDGYTVVPAMISVLLPLMVEDVAVEIDRQLGEDTDAADLLKVAFHVGIRCLGAMTLRLLVDVSSPAAAMLLQQSSSGKVVADQLSLGAAMRLGCSSKSTMELPDFSTVTSANALRTELLSCRGALTHSTPARHLHRIVRSLHDCTCGDIADELLTYGFMDRDDLASLFAIILRLTRPSQYDGCSMQHAYIEKMNDACVEELTHRARLVKCFVEVMMIAQHMSTSRMMNERVLDAATLACTSLPSVFRRTETSPTHTLAEMIHARFPQGSLEDAQRTLDTIIAMMEGSVDLSRALFQLSMSGILIIHYPELCQTMCAYIQETESRPRVLLLSRWFLSVRYHYLCRMPCKLQTGQPRMENSRSYTTGHTNNNNNTAADLPSRTVVGESQSSGMDPRDPLVAEISRCFKSSDVGRFVDAIRNPIDKRNLENPSQFLSYPLWNYLELGNAGRDHQRWCRVVMEKVQRFREHRVLHSEVVTVATTPLRVVAEIESQLLLHQRQELESIEPDTLGGASSFYPSPASEASKTQLNRGAATPLAIYASTYCANVMGVILMELITSEFPRYVVEEVKLRWRRYGDARREAMLTQALNDVGHGFQSSTFPDARRRLDKELTNFFSGNITIESVTEIVVMLVMCGVLPCRVNKFFAVLQREINRSEMSVPPYFHFLARRTIVFLLMHIDAKVLQYVEQHDAIFDSWEEFLIDPSSVFDCSRALLESIPSDYSHRADVVALRDRLRAHAPKQLRVFAADATLEDRMEFGIWFMLHAALPPSYSETVVLTFLDTFLFRFGSDAADPQQGQQGSSKTASKYDMLKLIQHVDHIYRSIIALTQPSMATLEHLKNILVVSLPKMGSTVDVNTKRGPSNYDLFDGGSYVASTFLTYDAFLANYGQCYQDDASAIAVWGRSALCVQLIDAVSAKFRVAEEWFAHAVVEFLSDFTLVLAHVQPGNEVFHFRELIAHQLVKGCTVEILKNIIEQLFITLTHLGVSVDPRLAGIMKTTLEVHMERALDDLADCTSVITKVVEGEDAAIDEFQSFCHSRGTHMPVKRVFVYYNLVKSLDSGASTNNNNGGGGASSTKRGGGGADGGEGHAVHLLDEEVLQCVASKDSHKVIRQVFRNIYHFFAVMSMELSITRYSVSEKRSTLSDRSRVRALLLRDVRARTGLQMIYLLSAGSYATGLDMLSHYGKFVEHRYNVRCSPLAVFAWTRSMASLSELVYGFLVEYFCPRKPPFDDVLRLLPENFSSLDMTLPMSHLAVMEKDNNPSFMDVKRYKYMAGSPSTYYLNLSAVLYDYLTKVEHRKDSLDTCIRLRQVLEGSASDLVMSCLLLLGAVHEWSPQFRENFWSVQTAAAASIAGHPGDASYGGDASAINTAGRDVSTSEQNRARSRRNISISNYFMIYTQRLIMDYDEWMRRNFEGAIVHRRSTIGLARSVAHSLNNFTQFEEGVPLAASVMVPEISDELMLALLNALLGAVDALDTPELRWESDGGIRYSYSIRRAEDAVLKSKASAQRRHELRPPVRLLRMDLYRPLLYSADLTEVMLAIGATPRDISALGFLFAYALRDSRLTGDGEDSNNVNVQEGAGSEVESSTAKTSTSARMAASLLYIHPSKNIHHRVSSVGLAEVDMLWSFFLSLFNDGMRRLLVRKHLDIPAEARLAVATKFCEIEPLVYIELLKQSRSNMWCASPDLGQLPSPYVDMWQMHTVLRSTGLVEAEVAHRLEAQKIMAKRPPPVEGAEKRERNVNMDEANALVPRDSVLSDVVCEEIMFDARHPHCFSFVRMLLHTMRVSSTGEDRLTNASILLRCIYKRLVRGRGELTKVVCLTAKECDEVARMWHAVMLTQNGSGQNSIQAIADFVATSPEDRATLEMVLNNIDNFIRMHLKAVMNWRTLLCVMCSFLVNADLLQQHQHSYVLTTRWAVIAQSICMALAYGGVSDQMQLLFLRILRSVRMAYEILERLRARENMFAHLAALPYGMMINYLQRPGSMQNLLQASSAWDSKKPVPTSEMRTLMDHMENALKSMEMITLPRPLLENTGVAARPMANNRELLQTFLQWIERCQSISKTGIPFERMALVLSGSMAALEEQSRQTEGEAGMLQLRGGMWNATAQEYIRLFMCLSVLLAKQLRILFSDPTKPPTASSLCAALRSDDLRVPLSSNGSNNPLDPNTSTKASKGTSLPKTGSSFSSLPSHTVHATLFTKAFATHCVVSAAERFITGTDVAEAGSPRNNSTELRSMTLSIPNVQVDRRSSINDALSIKERVLRQLMDVIMNFVMDSLQAEDDAATNYTKHRSRMHHLVASPQLELTYRDFCRVCYHLYQDIYYHGRLHYTPETLAAAGHLLTSVCRSVYHSYYLPIASLQGPSEHANGCGSAGSRRKSLASRARSARLFGPGGGLPVISTTAVAAPRLRDQFGAELDEVEAPPLKRQSIVDANTAMQLGQFGASAHHLVPDVGAQNRFVRMFLSSEFPFASYKVFAYVWAQLLPEMLLLQLEATAPFARNYWERMEEAVTGDELRLFFQLLHEVSFAAVAQAWIDDEIISQVIRNWLDEHATVSPSAKKEYKKLKEISTSAVYAISSAIVRRSRKRFSYIHSVRQMQFDIQVMHEFIVKAEHNRSTMKSFMEEATKRMSIKISADNEKESPLPQRHNNYSKRLHVLRTGSNSKGNFFEVRTVLHAWTDVLAHLDGTIAAIITAIENPALAHQRAKPATAIPIPCTLMDVEAPPEKMENSRATRASPSLRTEPLSKAASTAEAGAISDDDSAGAFKTERSTATSKAGASLASQPSSSEHQQQQSQNTRVPPSNLFAQALFSGRRGGKDEEQPLSAASSPAARSAGVPAAPRSSNNNNSNALRRDAIYSMEDVMAAHTPDRTWTVINDVVYDITKFVRSHPGGLETIYESCAGQDGTEKFFEVHGGNPHALRQLELLRIGVLGMGA